MKKKVLSAVLALALCLSLLPATALAAESESYPDPDDLNMQTVPGDGQITVTWAALDDVGTDTVERYTVYCCIEDGEYSAEAEYTGAGSHTFTGLTNGVEYSVGVDAEYNSEYSVGYEDYETPNGALKITTVTAEKGSLTVNWTKPERDGTITGYEVTVARADDPNRRTTVKAEVDAASCTVDNLAGGTTYTVAVRVIYEDGDRIDSAPADVYVPFHVANIWVGGVQVTDANKNDVLGDADKGATVSYDPDTNTLTLNGAMITGGDGIYAVGDLSIELGEAGSSITAPDGKGSYGIYVNGNLNISGSGSLTANGGNVDGGTDAATQSIGILVTGDLTLNSGSVTAFGGTSTGDTALSAGVYTAGDFDLIGGSLTATGKEAEAGETGLGFSVGVYTTGNLALEGGRLTATSGSAKGYFAQSEGVFTVGDFSLDSGSLTATGGDAAVDENASEPDGGDSEPPYAASTGVYTNGGFAMWGGSVTAAGGDANGPDAYSAGVAAKSDLSLHAGSLIATGGTAEGDYALSAGIEIASRDGEAYRNLAVYTGYLEATGGKAVGVTEADSAGVYAEYSGLYIYGGEDGTPVVKLTGGSASVTSENKTDEPLYASSNGVYAEGGDVEINAGDVVITGGSWEGADGDGWAIYAEADVEYDESGEVESVSGGNVTIDCTEAALIPSHSHGFTGTRVTLTGVDDDNGYAVYAGSSITIGDALIISDPEGAVVHEIQEDEYFGQIILENSTDGAPPAKSVTIVNISTDAYYYDAVLWAAKSGITSGTTATTFNPDDPCTRAQMATFLWRAAGSPEPVGTPNPFVDIPADAYYAKAVQWAYEQGITGGTSATTFSPDATCTRGQMATFLWRNAGSQAVMNNINQFADVPASAYYTKAVQWAYEQKITSGTSATTFSPDDPCTRAQMVTFLYRYFVK